MSFNEYLTNADKPYAENLNDGLLLSDAFDYIVPVSLPEHYKDKHFNNTTGIARKASVAIVTITQKDANVTINDTNITGTGDIVFRFYPNFNQFYRWSKVSWSLTGGSASVDLCKTDGTLILEDITNGADLSSHYELSKLQEIDVVIHLTNAELTNLTVFYENNHTVHTRVSAVLEQANVEGLIDDLNKRELKANKVNSLNTSTTNYPSCKAVDDALDYKEDLANKKTVLNDSASEYPASSVVYALQSRINSLESTVTALTNSLNNLKVWTKIGTQNGFTLYYNYDLKIVRLTFSFSRYISKDGTTLGELPSSATYAPNPPISMIVHTNDVIVTIATNGTVTAKAPSSGNYNIHGNILYYV